MRYVIEWPPAGADMGGTTAYVVGGDPPKPNCAGALAGASFAEKAKGDENVPTLLLLLCSGPAWE